MKRILRLVLIVAVLAIVVGAVYLRTRPGPSTAAGSVATATVQNGSLAASVNAAGNIQAHQTADLSFGQSGTVKKINAKLGDRVEAGAILAELDSADLKLQLRNAQVSLKVAQDQFAQKKNPNTEQDIATARAQLASAQASYDKIAAGASESEIASAQSQLASAQAAHDAAVKSAGTASSSLVSAAASVEKARIALQKAQGDYDQVAWRGDVAASSQAQALQSATIDFNQAKTNYETLVATSGTDADSKIASATASLRQAQASLTKLKEQVTPADIAAAQATLTQAKNNLDTLLAGPDANTLDIAQSQVEQAEISLDQAKLKLAQAEVVAPFDGIITAVSIKLGQTASGTAFSLADLDHLEIVVNMAEIDVNKARLGQPAEITLDAVPDAILEGQVTRIAPAGVQSSGVVNYPVTVALTNTTDAVKTGMTANLNVIVEQRDNVLTVPNRAVRTVGKQKMVTVLYEGQQIQVPVQTGLSSDSATEIVSGLKEGDVVVLTTTSTRTTTGGAGMGPGMGPGVGGPPPGM